MRFIFRDLAQTTRLIQHLGWSAGRLRQWQDHRLRRIVSWANERSPLYSTKFREHGVHPKEVRCIEDLGHLPVTERAELLGPLDSILARGVDRSRANRRVTSGSTGTPIVLYFGPEEMAVRRALTIRTRWIYRLYPWERRLELGGPQPRTPSPYQRLGIYRGRRVSPYLPQEEQARTYRAHPPEILSGYPLRLEMLGERLRAGSGPIHRPKLILTGGEQLSPQVRSFLEETFRAPVRDVYGMEEMGFAAWECPVGGGYHWAADCGIFEVLDKDRPVAPGEQGHLVLTSLYGTSVPLIRYRIGDLVVMDPEPCPCGCAFPRLKRIVGRENDLLRLPTGEWIHPAIARYPWSFFKELRRFQVIQRQVGEFELRIVRDAPIPEPMEREIRDYFQTHLGARTLEIHRVSEIPSEPTGKLRFVISHVPAKGRDLQ